MANYINFTKATFNPYNPRVLNEGQFSWMTHDTGKQIGSERQNTIDVWMYDNEGNSWYEDRYEGYGVFGGMDYYELLAKMNGYSEEDLEDKKVLKAMRYGKEMRDIGISLAFDRLPTKDKKRKVLFPALSSSPRYNWKRHDFTQEADSDPNQSWYDSEYDEYEDDYYDESVTNEAQKYDLEAAVKSIRNYNRGRYRGGMEELAEDILKDLGFGVTKNNIEITVDHLEMSSEGEDIPEDKDMVRELYPMLENTSLSWDSLKESLGLNEARYDKKKLLKAIENLDDAIILVKGKEYIIYNPNNNNADNAAMWGDKTIFALDQDGEEYEFKYSDIERFSESVVNEDLSKKTGYREVLKLDILKKGGLHTFFKGPGMKLDTVNFSWEEEGDEATIVFRDNASPKVVRDFKAAVGRSKSVAIKESVNEGRSINKISKDHASTVVQMSDTAKEWKEADGDRKSELLDKLRVLNKKKSDLEKELDAAVAGKDRGLELSLQEAEELAYLEIEVNKILEEAQNNEEN